MKRTNPSGVPGDNWTRAPKYPETAPGQMSCQPCVVGKYTWLLVDLIGAHKIG